jgi:restriction system protein
LSELPKFHEYLGSVLDVLAEGRERPSREVVVEVADLLDIPKQLREETIPSGQTRLANRVTWAMNYLMQAGCLDRPKRGVYVINDRGRRLREAQQGNVTLTDLEQFTEFREFKNRSREDNSASVNEVISQGGLTPLEQIEKAVSEIRSAVAHDLVERIQSMPPDFLEKAVLELLVAMGYGGKAGAAHHLGGPGDGGFDGVINQDSLGLERIYVQAKRFKTDSSVGRPDVQAFVGALHGMGAAGGVFITTSRFTPDAVAFAKDIKPRVILIDGPRLGSLMVAHGIGVQTTQQFTLVEVDEDFFEE